LAVSSHGELTFFTTVKEVIRSNIGVNRTEPEVHNYDVDYDNVDTLISDFAPYSKIWKFVA
jgi:hypothetical protein